MEFQWDPIKDRENQSKHRISFTSATAVFQDPFPIRDYDDRDYGEDRWLIIGQMGPIVATVVYTERFGKVRIISARKATPDEEARY